MCACSDVSDSSHGAYVLSASELQQILTAAMTYPDVKVGLVTAVMVSLGVATGFRGDDLMDLR